jgi:hypothetical protein
MAYLDSLELSQRPPHVFIFGGVALYQKALSDVERLRGLVVTRVWKEYMCDRFFPLVDSLRYPIVYVSKTYSQGDVPFDFVYYANAQMLAKGEQCFQHEILFRYPLHQEMQYLNIIQDLIQNGNKKSDRTGVGEKKCYFVM